MPQLLNRRNKPFPSQTLVIAPLFGSIYVSNIVALDAPFGRAYNENMIFDKNG